MRWVHPHLIRPEQKRLTNEVAGPIFFLMARQPLGGLGRLIFRCFAITHFLDTSHSVGLLWTSDQPVEETCT
jgi:hypothetical protein